MKAIGVDDGAVMLRSRILESVAGDSNLFLFLVNKLGTHHMSHCHVSEQRLSYLDEFAFLPTTMNVHLTVHI